MYMKKILRITSCVLLSFFPLLLPNDVGKGVLGFVALTFLGDFTQEIRTKVYAEIREDAKMWWGKNKDHPMIMLLRWSNLKGVVALQFDYTKWFVWVFTIWSILNYLIRLHYNIEW